MSVPERQECLRTFEHCLTAVSLFGTEPAWLAAQRLADIVNEAMGSEPAVYVAKYETTFLRAWREVSEAMRRDTAPHALAVSR